MREPVSIYCDWALHDELGDDVRLSEELTMGVLDVLERWKRDHGVTFDYYLLDCFWFKQPGDYTAFDPEMWPNGFGPACRRMQEMGLKPGLWLDTTGAAVAGWRPWEDGEAEHGWQPWTASLNARNGWSHCLFDGPYADGLRDAMLHACREWGVRLFKFDFADFLAVTERYRHLCAGEVYRRNVDAFRRICARVREEFPDLLILAYNGFAYAKGYLSTTTDRLVPGIEPHWLDVIDWLYSGDPRPADIPCGSLRRAVNAYQDHMVHKFHHSGIPLDHIDDHGCMVGGTNTIFYFGKRGWRGAWIRSLARGGCKAHFYGDVGLLDDGDIEFLKRARGLFFDLFRRAAATELLGGVPCQAPWHGFLTRDGEDGLLTLLNMSAEPARVRLSELTADRAAVLFHDEGYEPELKVEPDCLSVLLAPEQMALIGLGRKAADECRLGTDVSADPVPQDAERLALEFQPHERGLTCRISGENLLAEAEDRFDTLRLSFRLSQDGGAHRQRTARGVPLPEALQIEVEAEGQSVAPRRLVPDVPVWAGCSWVTGLYPLGRLASAGQVDIRFTCPEAEVDIFGEAWLQSG